MPSSEGSLHLAYRRAGWRTGCTGWGRSPGILSKYLDTCTCSTGRCRLDYRDYITGVGTGQVSRYLQRVPGTGALEVPGLPDVLSQHCAV